MATPLTFQQAILKLHEFWTSKGCVLWEPYNIQLGAGTGNPATILRVLSPEPWRVAYVEPSVRPDDGRYGENPNRMQKYYQYQVILQPDPGNPQELYLESLEALGINPRENDIRFVEDNWESPVLGAWGLGWEVWLNGQEITQFTYFQQAGGIELSPVAVEITYGLERIVLALQNKQSAWDINWMNGLSYREMMFAEEVEHCMYYFDIAGIEDLRTVYDIYERENKRSLENGAVIPAYDYVLKCSHLFNILDARGAIGVTERASYFKRMREMTRETAMAYAEKREALGYPLMEMESVWKGPALQTAGALPPAPAEPADVILEIGVEELPASDTELAQAQVQALAEELFQSLKLPHEGISVFTTPRRIVVYARQVTPRQADEESIAKGPPAERAFDADGNPTQAAIGFARGKGVDVADLRIEAMDGGEYVTAVVRSEGKPATEVLADGFAELINNIRFGKSMRWNETAIAFSRPIRWIVALFGEAVIPFEYAGVASSRITHGLRPYGSPEKSVQDPSEYFAALAEQGIVLSNKDRERSVIEQIHALADEVNASIPDDPGLLAEVVNLIESPTALRGTFDESYLVLPREVLVTVMRKHQRYFPLEDADGKLLPYFIAVRNGDQEHLENVIAGNEHVLTARFSDAKFFFTEDMKHSLAEYLPRLDTLTFHEKLGSMLDKSKRIVRLIPMVGEALQFSSADLDIAAQAAEVLKADLATHMVVELTSLQGVMGREYALRQGIDAPVANVIFEHWLPRGADDQLPDSPAGVLAAIVDRLDSLTGLFAVGLAPKSTADPYGLRRAALGILQILIDKGISVQLSELVDLAASVQPVEVSDEIKEQILQFIYGRLHTMLANDETIQKDVINAVLAEQVDNPYEAVVGIRELSQWIERKDWEMILDNFSRCVRISRKESETYAVDPDALVESQEQALYKAYQKAASNSNGGENVGAFMDSFVPLVPAIQDFFDNVLVNAEDDALRKNRLGLMQAISAMQDGKADLSELAGF